MTMPPADPPPTDPPPTDPPPTEDDPKTIVKGLVREALDEWITERESAPKKTKPANFLDSLFQR